MSAAAADANDAQANKPDDKAHVVVTFDPSDGERSAIEDVLTGRARLSFLSDLAEGSRGSALARADILMSGWWAQDLRPGELDLLSGVRLVQLLWAGVDRFAFADLPTGAVLAGNVGAYAWPIAEHVLAMTLALAKRLTPKHQRLAAGEFEQDAKNLALRGGVAGILGYGGIGRASAELLRGFGMRIHAIGRGDRSYAGVEFAGTIGDLEAVLRAADVFVISIPLTHATRGLIGERQLRWMKPNAILVNVARGDIVQERALYEHLRANPEFGAGIDTWWGEPLTGEGFTVSFPFFELPNVLGSPHNSGNVPGVEEESARFAAENVARFVRGEPIIGVADPTDYVS